MTQPNTKYRARVRVHRLNCLPDQVRQRDNHCKEMHRNNQRKVHDNITGRIFDSIAIAAAFFSISATTVSKVCNEREGYETYYGHKFTFV